MALATVNWERGKALDTAKSIVNDYFKEKHYEVPVFFDTEGKILKSYHINAFPTVYVIDKKGNIRYRNIGSHPLIEDILNAQVQSLS